MSTLQNISSLILSQYQNQNVILVVSCGSHCESKSVLFFQCRHLFELIRLVRVKTFVCSFRLRNFPYSCMYSGHSAICEQTWLWNWKHCSDWQQGACGQRRCTYNTHSRSDVAIDTAFSGCAAVVMNARSWNEKTKFNSEMQLKYWLDLENIYLTFGYKKSCERDVSNLLYS